MADLNDQLYREIMNLLVPEVAAAYPIILDNARDTLKKHIDKDVYDAYEPVVYKRRSDDHKYGISLGAQVYSEPFTKVIPATNFNSGGRLGFTARIWFNPSGEHKVKKWNTASGNDLIGRIEKKSPAYTWGQDEVPARPFWQRFIDEMVGGGEFENSFVDAMRGTEDIVADGNVIEDPSDRDY